MSQSTIGEPASRPGASPRPASRSAWLSVGLSVAALAGVGLFVDVRSVGERLAGLELRWVFAAFGLSLLQSVLLGLRWSWIARALEVPVGLGSAVAEYALSRALNQVLPTGMAGDAVRGLRHARGVLDGRRSRALEALALDRVSGQLGLWLLVLLTSPLSAAAELPLWRPAPPVLVLGSGLLLLLGWLLLRRSGGAHDALSRLRTLLARNAAVLFRPPAALVHLSISVLLVLTLLLQLAIAGRALGLGLSPAELLWVGPLMLLAASLPSFFGGWGAREGAAAMLAASLGLPASAGLSLSVTFGLLDLLGALPGLLVPLVLRWRAG